MYHYPFFFGTNTQRMSRSTHLRDHQRSNTGRAAAHPKRAALVRRPNTAQPPRYTIDEHTAHTRADKGAHDEGADEGATSLTSAQTTRRRPRSPKPANAKD